MRTFDIDLVEFAHKIKDNEGYLELHKAITLVISAASAHQDLRASKDAIDLLKVYIEGGEGPATIEEGTIGGSLFGHSIILYCRATETNTAERFGWFGRNMLTTEERKWQQEIMNFRNHVLAHFGLGANLPDGPTIRHALVWRIPPDPAQEMAVEYIELRASTRANLSKKLAALVDKTLQLAHRSFNERLQALQPILFNALNDNSELRNLGADCRYDGSLHQIGYRDADDCISHYRTATFTSLKD